MLFAPVAPLERGRWTGGYPYEWGLQGLVLDLVDSQMLLCPSSPVFGGLWMFEESLTTFCGRFSA